MTTSRQSGSTDVGSTAASESSTGELLHALTDDVRSLVQQELRSAQAELTGKAHEAGKAAAMLGGAAVLGALAAGTSATLLTRMLENFFPRTVAALIATSLYGGGAAILAIMGIDELRRALPLLPEHTVASLREDVRAATTAATGTLRGGAE